MLKPGFNTLFTLLMVSAFLCAFTFPPTFADPVRAHLESLFIPVSHPAYRIASWFHTRISPDVPDDLRSIKTIAQENVFLRQQNAEQQQQIEQLARLAGEKIQLGPLNSYCDRFSVAGQDSNTHRQGLILSTDADSPPLRTGLAVVYSDGLVGRIDRAANGAGGSAHVRLLTDAGFTVTGKFIRFDNAQIAAQDGATTLLPIVRGDGAGDLAIVNLPYDQVQKAGLRPEDWVILADDTWPSLVQGIRLGKIASIRRLQSFPLNADIRLVPQTQLLHIQDVWVLTRQPRDTQ